MAGAPRIQHADKALEQFATSKHDVLADLTCPWMWFVLSGLTLFALGTIYWSFFCLMTDSVFGNGVMVHGDGVMRIVARGNGLVENLNIRPGEKISRDQVVGQITNPEAFFSLSRLESEYRQLKRHIADVREGTRTLANYKDQSLTEKERMLTELQDKMKQSRERIEEMVSRHKILLAREAISRMEYYNMLENMQKVDAGISALLQQHIDSQMQQKDVLWANRLLSLQLEKEEQLKIRELDLALKIYHDIAWMRAEGSGTVIELLKDVGDRVQPGETVALLNPDSSVALKVVGFFPVAEGKKIQPGMSAYFAPAAFNPREYGHVRGVVLETSPYAASTESIAAELKNTDLVKAMLSQGPQMRVTVVLLPDPHTASRLLWTSRQGSPAPLDVGFSGTLRITSGQRPPISYLIPYLRGKIFGIGSEGSAAPLPAGGV